MGGNVTLGPLLDELVDGQLVARGEDVAALAAQLFVLERSADISAIVLLRSEERDPALGADGERQRHVVARVRRATRARRAAEKVAHVAARLDVEHREAVDRARVLGHLGLRGESARSRSSSAARAREREAHSANATFESKCSTPATFPPDSSLAPSKPDQTSVFDVRSLGGVDDRAALGDFAVVRHVRPEVGDALRSAGGQRKRWFQPAGFLRRSCSPSACSESENAPRLTNTTSLPPERLLEALPVARVAPDDLDALALELPRARLARVARESRESVRLV